MRRGGADLDRAPPEALDLLTPPSSVIPAKAGIHAHSPPEDHPALHARGWRRR